MQLFFFTRYSCTAVSKQYILVLRVFFVSNSHDPQVFHKRHDIHIFKCEKKTTTGTSYFTTRIQH